LIGHQPAQVGDVPARYRRMIEKVSVLLINARPWDSDLRPETTGLGRTSPSLRQRRYATEWPISARFAAYSL